MTALFKNKMMVQASSLGPPSTNVDACAILKSSAPHVGALLLDILFGTFRSSSFER